MKLATSPHSHPQEHKEENDLFLCSLAWVAVIGAFVLIANVFAAGV